ncbi:DsrE family protein [Aurantibacter sp.]|uniref:DsrE family protein n=1 Tax=Aurantibacter sp. TaxID=2807103 RepID=UPI0032648C7C
MQRKSLKSIVLILILLGSTACISAQKTGPVIKDYGKVWKIDHLDFKTNKSNTFKALFDVSYSPEDKMKLNGSLETAARFLNMHVQDGVPLEQIKVALVVHGNSSKDLLNSKAYKAKYGVVNPNEKMLKDLMNVGVDIVFCGQTFSSLGYLRNDLIPGVQISLSAMTALIQFQEDEYRTVF